MLVASGDRAPLEHSLGGSPIKNGLEGGPPKKNKGKGGSRKILPLLERGSWEKI